jgi:DNA-binding MarR family transcriptional regulator
MIHVTSESENTRRRRRLATQIKESLRDLRNQLSMLNRQVGAHLELKDVDLDCLDLINISGPLSPSALARIAGVHPATITGILDRLERAGWVARERDPADRRAVVVKALRERNGEMYQLLSGMNSSMDEVCAGYDEAQLELLADFLRRTTEAGRNATHDLAAGAQADGSTAIAHPAATASTVPHTPGRGLPDPLSAARMPGTANAP